MKAKFTSYPVISPLSGGKKWRLVKSFSYYVGKTDYLIDRGIIIEVPAGFEFDGCSIPKVFWSLIGSPMTGKYVPAAIIHDYCYFMCLYPRKICDLIFLNAMRILKVSYLKRKIIYYAVRAGGRFAYIKPRKQ